MMVEQKFSSHLVPERHRVNKPLVSLKISLSFGGMNLSLHVMPHRHGRH
jgi:hypothetical protein